MCMWKLCRGDDANPLQIGDRFLLRVHDGGSVAGVFLKSGGKVVPDEPVKAVEVQVDAATSWTRATSMPFSTCSGPCQEFRSGAQVRQLYQLQPRPHALSGVSRPGTVRVVRGGRGGCKVAIGTRLKRS